MQGAWRKLILALETVLELHNRFLVPIIHPAKGKMLARIRFSYSQSVGRSPLRESTQNMGAKAIFQQISLEIFQLHSVVPTGSNVLLWFADKA